MQTLNDFMRSLPIHEHTRMLKKLVFEVPLSRNSIYALRRGSMRVSLSTALKIFEVSGQKADPKPMTNPDIWEGLDAYYKAKANEKKGRKKS